MKLLSDYLTVCDDNPPALQTDRRTHRRQMIAISRSA